MVSSPAVVNGKLYTGADSGSVYCIDVATGTQIWKTPAGGVTNNILGSASGGVPNSRSSPIVVDNKVYVGALDSNVYCFNANTGQVLWKYTTDGVVRASVSVVDNAVYAAACTPATGSGSGSLYKIDANTGAVIWRSSIPYSMNRTRGQGNYLFAAPTVANGMVIIRSGLYYTFGVNATTGAIIWKYEARFNEGTEIQWGGVIQINAPLYNNGKVFMNDFYGIVCLNVTDGTEVWYTYLSREDVSEGLAYSFGRLYVVIESRVLHVLDAQNGAKISYYDQFGSQMHSAPALYNGSLYVGCQDWNLYCFSDPQPAPLTPIPMPVSTPTATPTVVPTATVSPSVVPEPEASPSTDMYVIAAAAAVIIVVVAVAAVILRKRK
jgi:outer membrane protein assembly factor BamB